MDGSLGENECLAAPRSYDRGFTNSSSWIAELGPVGKDLDHEEQRGWIPLAATDRSDPVGDPGSLQAG